MASASLRPTIAEGELMISENGEDERGARPTNNAPDRLAIARQNADGTPEYHGWARPASASWIRRNRCSIPKAAAGMTTQRRQQANLCFPCSPSPAAPVAPIALGAVGWSPQWASISCPTRFAGGVVKKNAVLVRAKGDFGSRRQRHTEAGHDVELVTLPATARASCALPLRLQLQAGGISAMTRTAPQMRWRNRAAFVSRMRGINRPTTIRFGPDGAAYLVTTARCAIRVVRIRIRGFVNPANAPAGADPGTGRSGRSAAPRPGNDDDND